MDNPNGYIEDVDEHIIIRRMRQSNPNKGFTFTDLMREYKTVMGIVSNHHLNQSSNLQETDYTQPNLLSAKYNFIPGSQPFDPLSREDFVNSVDIRKRSDLQNSWS